VSRFWDSETKKRVTRWRYAVVTTQQKKQGISGSGSIGERVVDNRILPAQGRANRRKTKYAILLRTLLIYKNNFMKYRKA